MNRAGLGIGLALLLSASAEAAGKFEHHLDAAGKLRRHHELKKALAEVKRAQQASKSRGEDVAAGLGEGILLAELGKKDDAAVAFRKALEVDSSAKLPWKVDAKLDKKVEALRSEVLAGSASAMAALVKPLPNPPPPAAPPPPKSDAPVETPPAATAALALSTPKPAPPKEKEVVVAQAEPEPAPAAAVEAAPPSTRSHRRTWALAPAIAGLAAAGVGAYFAVQAKNQDDLLTGRSGPGTLDLTTAAQYRDTGRTDQALAIGLIGAGAAVAVVGGWLFLVPAKSTSASASLGVGPGGVVVAGALP